MYPGHFAAGLALKAAEPRASSLGLMIGVSLLDLVHGTLVKSFGGRPILVCAMIAATFASEVAVVHS